LGAGKARSSWTREELRALAAEGIVVNLDPASRVAASADFGNIVRGRAAGLACPRNAEQIEQALLFANRRGLSFALRGLGRSSGGQSVGRDSVTLELSRLDHVGAIDVSARVVKCEPGARWRAVLDATMARGLVPQVMPGNLDLTVGGTLSVGGMGMATPRFGLAASNVVALEAISGDGRRLSSARGDEALSDVVLGGLGRCAVITSVTLRLRPTRPKVRTFFLLYDALEPWLSDLRLLRDEGRFDYLDSFCSASIQGMRHGPSGGRPFAKWFYGLHAALEHDEGAPPDADSALAGLHHRWMVHEEESDTVAFAARADPRFEMMARSGASAQAHPWLECFIPVAAIPKLMPSLLEALPLSLGDGHRLVLLSPDAPRPRLLMTPPDRELAVFTVCPMGVAPALLDDTLLALRRVNDMLLSAGGKRYLAGWLEMSEAGWRAHYGDRYQEWVEAKRRFDPGGVLDAACFNHEA
jgi:cytokinin dehydrogenase